MRMSQQKIQSFQHYLHSFCTTLQRMDITALQLIHNLLANPGWSSYEKFHEYWEIIIRSCYEGEVVSLRDLYHHDDPVFKFDNTILRSLPNFKVQSKELRHVKNVFSVITRIYFFDLIARWSSNTSNTITNT